MSTRTERLFEWMDRYSYLDYYAGNGDADHDGIPDRADANDGNGVDCSGSVWDAYAYAWAPDPPPFPLLNTSGLAVMAEDKGLWRPLWDRQRGDILLHATNGDVFHSGGPVGHTELDSGETLSNGDWKCYGSSGSGHGVGWQPRRPSFWLRRLRIPGLDDHSQPAALTPEQLELLRTILRTIDNARKDQPAMPKQVPFKGHSHIFAVTPEGRLRHTYYDGSAWHTDWPAEQPDDRHKYRFDTTQTLDVKTKEAGQSENGIDVYALGKLGEPMHSWWNDGAPSWGTEILPQG